MASHLLKWQKFVSAFPWSLKLPLKMPFCFNFATGKKGRDLSFVYPSVRGKPWRPCGGSRNPRGQLQCESGQAFHLDNSLSRSFLDFECGNGDHPPGTDGIFHTQLFLFINKPGDPPLTPTHQWQPTIPLFPRQTLSIDHLHFWPKLLRPAFPSLDWPA